MLEMSADVHDGTVEDEDDTEVADSPTIEENDVCTPLAEQDARGRPSSGRLSFGEDLHAASSRVLTEQNAILEAKNLELEEEATNLMNKLRSTEEELEQYRTRVQQVALSDKERQAALEEKHAENSALADDL